MPDHHVDVIDLGLTVGQAIDRGLMTEGFTRKQSLPEWMPERLTDAELEWFIGEERRRGYGKPSHWACRRVELNAMTDPELVAFVEEGLVRHGATAKVVPPAERIDSYAAACLEGELVEKVKNRIAELVSAGRIARKVAREFRDDGLTAVDRDVDVVEWLEDHRAKCWRVATNGTVVGNVAEKADAIDRRIDALITEAWGEGIATNEGDDQ